MPTRIPARILLRISNIFGIFSFLGLRKRHSMVLGLLFILLLASAAYYALKYNLSYKLQKAKYHLQSSMAGAKNSGDLYKLPHSVEEITSKHIYSEMGIPYVMNSKNPYIANERIIHLDLKGAPPLKQYMNRLFPMLKNMGATGLLIEYEDMFPYTGTLSDIAALNHYSRMDLLEILSMAENAGLKVIPLVQTFGHLEFALKRPSWQHLREDDESPQALCPSHNSSLVFIENMISQIMELHRHRITHLHIGCDEVFHMAECLMCRQKSNPVDDGGRYKDILFLKHVVNVAKIIKRRWPEVRPLIWDDMIRHIPDDLLSLFEIGKHVDPVVWWYTEDVYRFIPPIIWQKYSRVFKTAWAASAFKGAFGETLNVPHVGRHLENNMQWVRVMSEQTKYFEEGFAGIMLTGWQRYDHFAVLCELLPSSLPSLALCLLATSHGDITTKALQTFASTLGCPMLTQQDDPPVRFNLNNDPFLWDALKNCMFPGYSFYRLTAEFSGLETHAYEFIDEIKKHRGWLTDYNVRHKFVPPERAEGAITGERDASRILAALTDFTNRVRASLGQVFDEHTINEWIEQKPYPLILQIEKIISDAEKMRWHHTWERRPLKPIQDLNRSPYCH